MIHGATTPSHLKPEGLHVLLSKQNLGLEPLAIRGSAAGGIIFGFTDVCPTKASRAGTQRIAGEFPVILSLDVLGCVSIG